MRYLWFFVIALSVCLSPTLVSAGTQTDVGISIVDGSVRSFHLAIGEYFHVPEREIIIIRERRIRDDEIPVILYIARHAHVRPDVVIKYRQGRHSWMEVTLHFGLSPEIYYVPVHEEHGPPYGKAYGHYKKRDKMDWRMVNLEDDDIVNFVNLRFISERYGYDPDEVIRLRSSGKDFFLINESVRRGDKGHNARGGHDEGKRDSKEKHNKGHKDD